MALNFPDNPTIGLIYSDETSGFYYRWDGTVWQSFTPGSSNNIKILDDVSSSFNGITTSFSLTSGGIAIVPISPAQIVINLGGVVQDPSDDYYVSSSNIIFTDPPDLGASFSGISLGPAVPITNIIDGTVVPQDLSTGGPWWTSDYKIGIGTTVPSSKLDIRGGDAYVSGVVTATQINVTNVRSTNINATGIITANNVIVGAAQTSLIVLGDARITGILTIGTASITLNGTTNTGTIGTSRIVSLASGIKTLFYESTAPTGWTKVTSHHDKCLRVVNTNGGGSGGTSSFSTVMASRTPAGSVSGSNTGGSVANTTATGSVSGSNSGGSVSNTTAGGSVDNTTLSVNQIPGHNHGLYASGGAPGTGNVNVNRIGGSIEGPYSQFITNTGGGGAHNHGFTGSSHGHTFNNPSWSGNISINAHNHSLTQPSWSGSFTGSSMDFDIQYIDLLLCSID